MKWSITIKSRNCTKEYEIPFTPMQTVYYVHKKKWCKKWVITKTSITGIWIQHECGVILRNDVYLLESGFQYLFTDREEAIDFCIKKNAHSKVKIYGE